MRAIGRMPRRAASVIGLVLGGALLTACGTPFAAARDDAEVVPVASLCAPDVVAGGLPDDFEPVAVYACDAAYEFDPPTTVGGVAEETALPPPVRHEGDLTALLEAFAASSDPPWPGPCAAIGFAGPSIWAADARDRLVRLEYPADGCSMPKADPIFAALDALAVVP